jgi:hypothetical protein
MNLKILQWLLKHRDALLKVVEIAKRFDRSAPYLAQWALVNEIAQIVLPILEAEALKPTLLSVDWDVDVEAQAFALGAEVSALGMDWKTIIEVLIPILIAILQAIGPKE